MIKNPGAAKIHYQLLILLAILIPSGFYKLGGLVIALLAISWVFVLKGYKKIRQIDTSILLCLSFFAIIVMGLLYTTDVSTQLQYISRKLPLLLIPLAFIGFSPNKDQLRKLKMYFVFSTVIFVLIANLYALGDYVLTGEAEVFLSKSHHNKFTYYGLTRVFSKWHPTYVSLFLNMALVFAYELYYATKKYKIWIVISSFAILNILLLTSFIGIVSLLLLLGLFMYKLLKKNKTLLAGVSILLVLAVGFFYFYNPLKYSKIDKFKETEIKITDKKEERNLLNLRLAKWKSSLQVFSTSPFFGVTNGDYKQELYLQYLENEFMYCAEKRYSSHNQYLYTATSNGLLGFSVLMGMFLVAFFKKSTIAGFFPFLGIMSVYFMTEDVLARQQGMVFFIFFYILLTRNLSGTVIKSYEK